MKGSFKLARKTIPAISVIIPMYNTEKYVGECLDSILAQTFQDFEVIVVDDCSTDNSCKIVESYAEKFTNGEGRLELINLKVNSGSGAVPRNIGIRFSRGEYIYLIDNDDAIFPDALEKLYNTAKDFDADRVSVCEAYFTRDENITFDTTKLEKVVTNVTYDENSITVPTLESEDLAVRVKKFSEGKIPWGPPHQFVRRELLWENDIFFPKLSISDDFVFGFFSLCAAKKFVHLPTPLHIYRIRSDSLFHGKKNLLELIHQRIGDFFIGMEALEKFMNKYEFFVQHPEYKYAVFDFFSGNCALESVGINIYSQIPAPQLDNLIRAELNHIEDKDTLLTYIFFRMNIANVRIVQQQNLIRQMQAQLQQK